MIKIVRSSGWLIISWIETIYIIFIYNNYYHILGPSAWNLFLWKICSQLISLLRKELGTGSIYSLFSISIMKRLSDTFCCKNRGIITSMFFIVRLIKRFYIFLLLFSFIGYKMSCEHIWVYVKRTRYVASLLFQILLFGKLFAGL